MPQPRFTSKRAAFAAARVLWNASRANTCGGMGRAVFVYGIARRYYVLSCVYIENRLLQGGVGSVAAVLVAQEVVRS